MTELDDETDARLLDFATRLRDSQQDMPIEFYDTASDNWQELLGDD